MSDAPANRSTRTAARRRGDPAPAEAPESTTVGNGKVASSPESAAAASVPAASPTVTPRGVRGLIARFEHLIHELGKFGVVGMVAYSVDVVLFNVFRAGIDIDPLVSKCLSTSVAATVAFIGNRFWTWRHRPRSGLRREYTLYFLFNVVGLAIGLACLGISHYGLGRVWPVFQSVLADNISTNIVGMALGTMFRFWSYRTIVFRAHSVSAGDTGHEDK